VQVCVYRASELFYLYLCLVLAVSNGVVRSQLFSGLLGGHLYLGLSPLLAPVSTVGKPRLVVVAVQGAPRYRRLWHVCHLNFLTGNISHARPTLLSAKHLDYHSRTARVHCGKSRMCSCSAEPKGACQACRSLVNRVRLLVLLDNHSRYSGMLITCCRTVTDVLVDTRPSGRMI